MHHFTTQEEHDTVYLSVGGEYDEPWVAAVKEDITDEEEEAEVTYNFPYQRVEYLESSGTQWIDTGIPNNSDSYEIDVTFMWQQFAAYGIIFGSYDGEVKNSWRIILQDSDNNRYYANFNTRCNQASTINGTSNEKGTIQHIVMNQWNVIGKQASINQTKGEANTKNIFLFEYVHNRPEPRNIGCRIYSFKVNDNGTILCNLFPVRIGQVGYMYDTVSGKLFGNIGTGNFVLGPDLY